MAQIECGRGHLYDPEKYAVCPYCNTHQQITVAAAGRTAPIHSRHAGTGHGPPENGAAHSGDRRPENPAAPGVYAGHGALQDHAPQGV